jgi:hypothetical protein
MLNLIVSAYLIFDPEGKGYIVKSGIEKMLEEHGAKHGAGNAMLSQQRWNEMVSRAVIVVCVSGRPAYIYCLSNIPVRLPIVSQDWDANGTIDFAEFVFAFASWVDIDEGE